MAENIPTVVIDNGSQTCKVGFGTDGPPRAIFPTCVARRRFPPGSICPVEGRIDQWAGEEAAKLRGLTWRRSRPIESGHITNFDDIEFLWKHGFRDYLHAEPEEHPILMTEAAWVPKYERENITQSVFEILKAPAFYLATQSVLSLYASGRTTGLVFDCGHETAYSVPIYEGFKLPRAVFQHQITGRDISDYLIKLIHDNRGYPMESNEEQDVMAKVKEELCYVTKDYEEEINASKDSDLLVESSYKLPDGKSIQIGKERFIAPEALFDPCHLGVSAPGPHFVLYRSILRCDKEIKNDLYKNIVLAGGTTKLPGCGDRLKKELARVAPPSTEIEVFSHKEPINSAWIGGSILSSLSTFKSMCISAAEYDEWGPILVARKCL